MFIYLVLPVFNEEANLRKLVKRCETVLASSGFITEYVIVDDGSVDETPAIIADLSRKFPVVPITNHTNAGLGTTLARGLKAASSMASDGDVIVTMDGDGTHDPAYILNMINMIEDGADVVIASRFTGDSGERGLSAKRKVLSRGAALLLRFFFPIDHVRDYTCGYRAFRPEVIKDAFSLYGDLFIEEEGFSAAPEILIKASKLNPVVHEIPFVLRYDKKIGASKMKIMKTIVAYLRMISKLRKIRPLESVLPRQSTAELQEKIPAQNRRAA